MVSYHPAFSLITFQLCGVETKSNRDHTNKTLSTMRVVLVQSSNQVSSPSGGWKANVAICHSLQNAGHKVLVLAIYPRSELTDIDYHVVTRDSSLGFEVVQFEHHGIEVCAMVQPEDQLEDNLLQPSTKPVMQRLFKVSIERGHDSRVSCGSSFLIAKPSFFLL